eukprot:gnl/TRDRNA2_/TRDRNA2_89935_c0_seq5.p1 gnl/TRDRNA2_/TRDRNA2_89935_c0~~gnl/TRDRNA2_/TRDRNA2_89935_c0_seq5.p1  ORF type:complete len:411 (+),score=79.87 gnl/TRDRNA2_/TRDRNA2_89935_c0_seq5:106-1233(+)
MPIATFDDAKGTTWSWQTVNDPIMGGKSNSTFEVDTSKQLGIWDGEVRLVPGLQAPGFCQVQAPGLYKEAAFPDLSGTRGIEVRARQANMPGLTNFNIQLRTNKVQGPSSYTADFEMTDSMHDITVPWSAFNCQSHGQNVTWCPELSTQLARITNLGLGTAFPGRAAAFHVEIASISGAAEGASDLPIDLAIFDSHKWQSENDPVMGGQSDSKFVVEDGIGHFTGTCRIVPKLQAPGFTIALTTNPLMSKFPDISSADGLILGVKNAGGNVTDFKVAFCDARINYFTCQFASYKADFTVSASDNFGEVFLPWSKFSDKWSASTGKHTEEHPPAAATLKAITQLQFWVEGVAGEFNLQIHYVRAGKDPSTAMTIVV